MQKRNIPLLDEEQRESMRRASRFNAQLMDFIRPQVLPGVTTGAIDRLVDEYTRDHGHTPACLGYHGFPKTICTSINEVICHGIPDDTVLTEGDIVNVDLTTIVDGWYGDQSETVLIGNVSDETRNLVQVTFDSLYAAINVLQPGSKVIEIGRAIAKVVRPHGYSIVRDYQGHGIGQAFHQDPGVPHYPTPGARFQILRPGVCFTIEPMINQGRVETALDKSDGWTVRTRDGKLSAQFEHTILMTEEGPEILTRTQHGPQEGHRF